MTALILIGCSAESSSATGERRRLAAWKAALKNAQTRRITETAVTRRYEKPQGPRPKHPQRRQNRHALRTPVAARALGYKAGGCAN